jgi:anti-sigma factor RsiW
MNRHLSPRELVDAADAALGPDRLRHLERCERCRAELAGLRQSIERVSETSDVPEPSPLFWDHLPERVRRTTSSESIGQAWWRVPGWRALAVAAPAVIAVLVLVAVERQVRRPDSLPIPAAPSVGVDSAGPIAPATGDVPAPAWSEMAELTRAVPADELPAVAPLRAGTADALIEDLTRDERTELLRLLREAMGEGT